MTAFAIVHSFVLQFGVTNQLQSERFSVLRRLVAMWYNCYNDDPGFEPSSKPHVPDVRSENGLQDVMAIANVLELGTVLDRRSYFVSGIHWAERLEMGAIRSLSRRLLSLIAQNFVFSIDGKQPVPPGIVFQRSLVEFAAAVVVYKEDMSTVCKTPGCSSVKVRDKMVSLFQANHPELLPKLLSLIEARAQYLSWQGPTLSIVRRTADHSIFRHRKLNTHVMTANAPLWDFTDFQLFTYAVDEGPDDNIPEDDVTMKDATRGGAMSGLSSRGTGAHSDAEDGGKGVEGVEGVEGMDIDSAQGAERAESMKGYEKSQKKTSTEGGMDAQGLAGPSGKEGSSSGERRSSRRQKAKDSQELDASSKPPSRRGKGKTSAAGSEKLAPKMEEGQSLNENQSSGSQKAKESETPTQKLKAIVEEDASSVGKPPSRKGKGKGKGRGKGKGKGRKLAEDSEKLTPSLEEGLVPVPKKGKRPAEQAGDGGRSSKRIKQEK